MNLASIIQTLDELPFSTTMRESDNLFPMVESMHVLAIVCVVGVIGVVDLRLVGWSMMDLSASKLLKQTVPLVWIAFVAALVTGAMMFVSHAVDYSTNPYILWKFGMLGLAGLNMAVFHLIGQRRIADWDMAPIPPPAARMAGVLSIALWIAVVAFGRWIAYAN
jgi:phosphoglycerol transferase MdoB-like AlkP superfamily enzyme